MVINPQISDAVSIIITCVEEKTYFLGYHGSKGHFIPFTSVKSSSWGLAAGTLYKKYTGQETQNATIVRIYKIWQSDSAPPLFNTIFKISVTPETKKKIIAAHTTSTSLEKGVWTNVTEIASLVRRREMSLEMKTTIFYESLASALDVLSDEILVSSEILFEVTKEKLTISPQTFQNQNDYLLTTCKLNENDQLAVYDEYLKAAFPNILMNFNAFKQICLKLGLNEFSATNYFRASDTKKRACLSFKEMLHFIALTEPNIPFIGVSADLKNRFVFRYFDRNDDGRMEMLEFKELFSSLYFGNKIQMETELTTLINEMNFKSGSTITLTMFMSMIASKKLKGVQNLICRPKRIFDFLNISKSKPAVPISGTPSSSAVVVDTFVPLPFMQFKPQETIVTSTINLPEFSIGSHSLRVGAQTGTVLCETLNQVDYAFYQSGDAALKEFSPQSVDMFGNSCPSSIVINLLRDFTNENLPGSAEEKPAFRWMEDDFKRFTTALREVCVNLIPVLKDEPRLLSVQSPVYILGDLHGNFQDLCIFEKLFWNMGLHLSPGAALFLGDFVDRGPYGVEVIGYLYAHKIRNPKRMFLVRGNHEIRDVQMNFTFHLECMKKFGSKGPDMWNMINNVMDVMPLAAVVDEKIFCCHGGIPPPWLCPSIGIINKIPCPLVKMGEQSTLAWELVWNDPLKDVNPHEVEQLNLQLSLNNGFADNKRRGTGHWFNDQALLNFLRVNNLAYVVRAHEVQKAGFQLNLKNRLLTVFSSSNYNKGFNDAACILVQDRKLRIFRIDTSVVRHSI